MPHFPRPLVEREKFGRNKRGIVQGLGGSAE